MPDRGAASQAATRPCADQGVATEGASAAVFVDLHGGGAKIALGSRHLDMQAGQGALRRRTLAPQAAVAS